MPIKLQQNKSVTVRIPKAMMHNLVKAQVKRNVSLSTCVRNVILLMYADAETIKLHVGINANAETIQIGLGKIQKELEAAQKHYAEEILLDTNYLNKLKALVVQFSKRAMVLQAKYKITKP